MNLFGILVIGAALAGTLASAQAAETKMLTQEPGPGKIGSGETVLVDDGTCPPGQIKQVVGGSNRSVRTGVGQPGRSREVKCVRR